VIKSKKRRSLNSVKRINVLVFKLKQQSCKNAGYYFSLLIPIGNPDLSLIHLAIPLSPNRFSLQIFLSFQRLKQKLSSIHFHKIHLKIWKFKKPL